MTTHTLPVDAGQMADFVNVLFPYASEGVVVSLRSFYEGESRPSTVEAVQINGGRLAPLINAAVTMAQHTANVRKPVVFCPSIAGFSNPKHAREEDLVEGYELCAELDQHPSEARQKLEGVLGPATAIVASGGRWTNPETGEAENKLHVHWRLSEPATGDHLPLLKKARRLIADIVGGDPSHVPVTHPIRWPGSWHRKGEPRMTRTYSLKPDREIDLLDALDRLETVAPKASRNEGEAEPPRSDGEGDPRPDAVLIANVVSGREYHPTLVPLAARFVARGMAPGTVVEFLRGLMEQVPPERRDERWSARFDSIPAIVGTASDKFTPPEVDELEAAVKRLSTLSTLQYERARGEGGQAARRSRQRARQERGERPR